MKILKMLKKLPTSDILANVEVQASRTSSEKIRLILSTIPKTDRTERADIITADGYGASETFYVNYTITSRKVDLTQEENIRYPMERIEAIQESIREYRNELKNKKTL